MRGETSFSMAGCFFIMLAILLQYCRRLILVFTVAVCSTAALADIQFEDATGGSGITHAGESWGMSWGDVNADGWPDLFVNNHRGDPALLVNLGNGSFQNRWQEVDVWADFPNLDQHGASWGDFNNDGYEDLFVSLGSRDDVQLLVNQGGLLVDRTTYYGLDAYTSWPGRLPVWVDIDDDGFLDWIMSTRGYGKTFLQENDSWVDYSFIVGPACQNTQYTQLIDVDADGRLDLVCDNQTTWPNKVYDTSTIPYTSLASLIPQQGAVNDTAVGDFDNNLRNDIFQVRGLFRLSEAALASGDQQIEAQIILDDGGSEDKYMRFKTDGILSFVLDWNARRFDHIYVGSTGIHPGGYGPTDQIAFTLDPANPDNWGIMPHDSATMDGLWIGYDDSTGYWDVRVSAGTTIQMMYFLIDSTLTITDLTVGNFPPGEGPYDPKLLMNFAGGFVEEADTRGLADPIKCISAAAADFDNDMDQDIYVVCRDGVSNSANIIYENQGDGTFLPVPNGGGAAGGTGLGVGVGENVALADYDVDGFIDVFVTNGLNIYPEEPLYEDRGGPDKLFHNLGNTNSWIELQLVGTASNRTAVGAKVYATAGGVTQLREQNGGYHRWAQNHQRIHFGLASNQLVSFTVEWPSGAVDEYVDVAVNQLYEVTESTGIAPIVLGEVEPSVCAQPEIDPATEVEMFVWKDCATSEWHIYTTAGPVFSEYIGQVTSNQDLSAVTPLSLEFPNDVLDTSDPQVIEFEMRAWVGAHDEFSFIADDQASVCLEVFMPEDTTTLLLGSARVPIGNPIDLNTLGPCTNGPVNISIDDVSVDEAASLATFTVSLAEPSVQTVEVDFATVAGTATDTEDYQGDSGTVIFLPGEVSQAVDVTVFNDTKGEIDESFIVELTNPVNGTIIKPNGAGTIIDDELSACGEPDVDPSVESGLFIWTDCQGADIWNVRAAGGSSVLEFKGMIVTPQPFLFVAPIDIEPGTDTLDDSVVGEISYLLKVSEGEVDEFSFQPTDSNDELCFDPEYPLDDSVLVGADRLPLDPSLASDLGTLGECAEATCHP